MTSQRTPEVNEPRTGHFHLVRKVGDVACKVVDLARVQPDHAREVLPPARVLVDLARVQLEHAREVPPHARVLVDLARVQPDHAHEVPPHARVLADLAFVVTGLRCLRKIPALLKLPLAPRAFVLKLVRRATAVILIDPNHLHPET